MKKILVTIVLMLIGDVFVYAKPAVRCLMQSIQPDGTTLSVYKRGDERSHNVFTKDGYLVLKDDARGYCYADVDNDGKLIATAIQARDPESRTDKEKAFLRNLNGEAIVSALRSKEEMALGSSRYNTIGLTGGVAYDRTPATRGPGLFHYAFPVKGKQKGLVILVEFPDVKFNSKNSSKYNRVDSKTYFTEMLNKPGFNTYGATGSARDWFVGNSGGLFEPEFDVFGPVTLPNNMSYYGGNDYLGEDKNPGQMVIDACNALDGEIDFKEYDRNGDGYVDNVYVFYAGYGEADSDESDAIWPHSWSISDAAGKPLFLDGVYVDSYACSNETCGYSSYGVLKNRPDGIGTFVHEFSHVMGLPDLYSTNTTNTDPALEPFTPGEYSVMDYGPYNNEGLTPPNYSTYERYAFDWIAPGEIEVGSYVLDNLEDTNKAYIIRTERENEFFLLENRQLKGWDKYLPGHGMLVWHVDFYQPVFYANTVNNTRDHQYVDLVEADNIQDYPVRYNPYYGYFEPVASTQNGDTFPGSKNVTAFGVSTTPALKSWSGKDLGVELMEIAENNGIVSFKALRGNGSGVTGIEDLSTNKFVGSLYTLDGVFVSDVKGCLPDLKSGIYILRRTDGSSIKIVI